MVGGVFAKNGVCRMFEKRLLCGVGSMVGLVFCGLGVISAGVVFAGPMGAAGDLYVVDGGFITEVDSVTGEVVGHFVTSEMFGPSDARFGPNGHLFLAEEATNSINEFDGQTGTIIRSFTRETFGPSSIRFESNGNLIVYEIDPNVISEFDRTGEYLGTFASGGLSGSHINFGPDGNLYASNTTGSYIQRFDADGNDLGIFASGGGLDRPFDHDFGPNGNLYVCSYVSNEVIEYDGKTGALVGTFISTHLDRPKGIVFAPDGDLWVSNGGGSSDINRFDGTTGEWLQQVTGFIGPGSITVKPEPCLVMTVSPLISGQSATWDVNGATAGARVAVAYGFTIGTTIVSDQLGFCASFGIDGASENKLIGTAVADGTGHATVHMRLSKRVSGLTLITQAAEQGTCPAECISNYDKQVVQ